jgi:hypothetical protein
MTDHCVGTKPHNSFLFLATRLISTNINNRGPWFLFVVVMANGREQCVIWSNERKKYMFVIEDGFKGVSWLSHSNVQCVREM